MNNAVHSTDYANLRSKWVDIVTGRQHLNKSSNSFRGVLNELNRQVAAFRAKRALDSAAVFIDAPLTENYGVQETYRRIHKMAVAWATPGSEVHNSTSVIKEVLFDTRKANINGYNASIPEFGNWWTWEVGAAFNLANILVLTYDHLTPEDIANNCAAIDYYVPDPWYSKPVGRGRSLTTGTGRINLCKVVVVRSIVDENTQKLERAIAGLPEAWRNVTNGSGFYADGSYLTHNTVAYNGSYGVETPKALADLFSLLSVLEVDIPYIADFYSLIDRAFLPIVYRGQVLDNLRGRSITRSELRSKDEAAKLIEAVVKMQDSVGSDTAARWLGRCKSWLTDMGGELPLDSINRVVAQQKLDSEPVIPLSEPPGVHLFNSMNRAIVRRNGWALSIAGASDKVALYEAGNGENPKGFYTGAGMTTLYNDDIGQFDDEFWPTVDWYRLPGTTTDSTPLPDNTGGTFGRALSPGDWTGGASLGGAHGDAVLTFAQHLSGPGDTKLNARKFWMVGSDAVVALGSDIRSESGNAVETIVENRNLHNSGDNRLIVDGVLRVPQLETSEFGVSARWAHVEDVGGYIFGESSKINFLREARRGAWSDINVKGPAGEHSRRYVTFWIDHGELPESATYEYTLLPGASAEFTRRYSSRRAHEVLSNNEHAQAVRMDGNILGIAFWKAYRVAEVSSDGPGIVVLRKNSCGYDISVSAPGQGPDMRVEIEFDQRCIILPRVDQMAPASAETRIESSAAGDRSILNIRAPRTVPLLQYEFRLELA